MKKTRTVRFKSMVDVYKNSPVPLVDKEEDGSGTESAMNKEDSNGAEPTMSIDSNVTEPAMNVNEEDTNGTEPALFTDSDGTEPAMDTDSNVTELAMHIDGNVTEPVMDTDSNVTESAMDTDSSVTEPAMDTDSNVTEPAMDIDSNVTELAKYIESQVIKPAMYADSNVIESAMDTDSNVTKAAMDADSNVTEITTYTDISVTEPPKDTKDRDMAELALDLVESAIDTAINSVEEDDDYTIKDINWLTHGEFTPEKGRKLIEEFVLTWEYQHRWVHYTKLVETRDLIHSFHYIYSVRWSVPTSQTPTAFGSAFAFFTIKFNKNKPPSLPSAVLMNDKFRDQKVRLVEDAPIDVSFTFEGQSLVHRPGMTRFRENWVRDMVEAKHNIMKSFPF